MWGARTLSASPDWQHLNVRRLVGHVAESLRTGTDWAAYEPNDEQPQARLRGSVTRS
nr:hypothetical protein [Streptomyces sp. TLI_235]